MVVVVVMFTDSTWGKAYVVLYGFFFFLIFFFIFGESVSYVYFLAVLVLVLWIDWM